MTILHFMCTGSQIRILVPDTKDPHKCEGLFIT